MISKPAIVGCGTVGATLSYGLAKSKLISDLKIYDFDNVSEFNEIPAYPFLVEESGLPKIQVVKFRCRYINPALRILTYREKVISKLNSSSFVIDCRDNKGIDIGANIRISLDGHMLYLDSMSKYDEIDYHRYIETRNPDYIEKAIDIIIQYLRDDKYIYKDFRFYDLKTGEVHILQKENFYGIFSS